MRFRLNKNSDFPIYQQLKEQIRYFLLSGVLQPGTQVPPPKELAIYLRINRNTVIAAYKELEKEGLLITRHGQGTYISEKLPKLPKESHKQALLMLAQETLEKVRQLGFSAEDFFTIIFNKTVLGNDTLADAELRALLVDCNKADLMYFQQTLQKELGIQIDVCLLSELADKLNDDIVIKTDFVITTFIHIEDAKSILEPSNKEILAIMVAPHLQVYMQIAQLPPDTQVGIACGTEKGAYNMRNALESAGVRHIFLDSCGTDNKAALNKMVNNVEWVVCSTASIDEIRAIAPPDIKFMEFFSEIDRGGIEILKQYIKRKATQK